ncbi:hypothetical protein [Mesorhizobium australicum]|uniref:hypothetical protein n=1 Tax=Mesorhizobium australicum TaxID=536018 RepID=UPI00333DFE20
MAGAMQQSPEDHVATQRNEAAMTKYQVEEIKGHTVVPSGIVVENDSMKAAEATAGQSVSPRALQDHWFRVVDEEQAAVYEYSLAGPDSRPRRMEGAVGPWPAQSWYLAWRRAR